MKLLYSQVKNDLKSIKDFQRFLPLEDQFSNAISNVFHRHDHLAKVVAECDAAEENWRCYIFCSNLSKPISILNPLSIRDALFIYRADYWHEKDQSSESDAVLKLITAAIVCDHKVAGITHICPDFLAYILTRYSSKNSMKYNNIRYSIGYDENHFIDEYLNECKSTAYKERDIRFLRLK